MEHEDNAHLDNVLQSSPHLMDNLQMASGDGVCDNVVAEEIGSSIGGKFGEHEGHDQEEWKYIKEGQQSEKQQERIRDGIDSKDMEDVEDVGNGHGYVYEVGDVGADDLLLLDKHEVGNGVVGISAAVDVDAINTPTGIEENEALKNYGDFSPTSNTTSIGGEDVDSDNGVLQVEMKIETATLLQSQPVENLLGAGGAERNFVEMEEEEPSSLATNTTNGTNSLSENAPLQQLSSEKNDLKTVELSIENKENANPSLPSIGLHGGKDEIIRPNDLDFETHSHLNPNALVFVPSVGSNPASPLVPTSDSAAFTVGEPALNSDAETAPQPHPNSIARHLLSDDDFVAQSPRKGSVESNLDGIALPEENDFEHEAAKRPHELEQEDDLIGVGTVQHLQQFENHNNDGVHLLKEDKNAEEADYSLDIRHSPANIIDHGPETSVDLDADIGIQLCDNDNLAQQHKFEMPDPIEDVLNTVQPLPIDTESVNVSFIEERSQQELEAGGKELLDVEEKDYISQSPSTEEMKMNMQNQMHSSIKDIPQIPIDMHDGANMQESFYLDSTSTELQNADDVTLKRTGENLTDASNPYLVADHISFENSCFAKPSGAELEIDFEHEHPSLNIFAPEFTPGQKSVCTDGVSPSPMSTEEKHLVEDTKELATKSETSDELEQKIDDLKLSTKDGILSQVCNLPIYKSCIANFQLKSRR
ncbi:PREDICTED: 205 kDa microtubule-associated protein [Rhagoletis zephyria]|uniref:205 kDa microtubule-associated protein n=1 Tax=Rhagoletis zephyria TaxID=28612 RepID=UPI000811811C|nr:PREDICTED: 205 kDa microtubule-associated protein [Rhagoletis zephyria]